MPINPNQAADDWSSGASGKVEKLVRNYKARTDKIARATSAQAQQNYIAGVTDPTSHALRLARLQELTDAELNNAMEQKGRSAYTTGVSTAKEKYRRRVTPFLNEIDAILPNLPARTRDPQSNVINRVVPLAVGLNNLKKSTLPR